MGSYCGLLLLLPDCVAILTSESSSPREGACWQALSIAVCRRCSEEGDSGGILPLTQLCRARVCDEAGSLRVMVWKN
jgi:hypothetical protein